MTRFVWLIVISAAALSATALVFFHPRPVFIWNASPSVPIGLYIVHPAGGLQINELVVAHPPKALAQFLSERRYLPDGVPMLKRVLALPGQIVCRNEHIITIDGIAMDNALDRDVQARPLPIWKGCQRIADGEVFLMNSQSEVSFDGRYFGLLPKTSVMGRADPLWTGKD